MILLELVLDDFAAHLHLVSDTTTSSAIPILSTILYLNGFWRTPGLIVGG
jgi:hypothetical protein